MTGFFSSALPWLLKLKTLEEIAKNKRSYMTRRRLGLVCGTTLMERVYFSFIKSKANKLKTLKGTVFFDKRAREIRMNEKTKELYEMFRVGIENERSAQEFYRTLIEKSTSDFQKEIFSGFLQEEEKHERELIEAYGEMKEKLGL